MNDTVSRGIRTYVDVDLVAEELDLMLKETVYKASVGLSAVISVVKW